MRKVIKEGRDWVSLSCPYLFITSNNPLYLTSLTLLSVGTGSPVCGPSGLDRGWNYFMVALATTFHPMLGVLLFYMGPCLPTVCWLRCEHWQCVSLFALLWSLKHGGGFYFQVSGYDFAAPGFKTAQDKAVSVLFHLRRDFRLRRVFLDLSRTFAGYK